MSKEKMTKEKAIKQLNAISSNISQEDAHRMGDAILLEFLKDNGLDGVESAYVDLRKRCGGFWYA